MVGFRKSDFDRFVAEQREIQASQHITPFDPHKELRDWLDRLDDLYSNFLGYLDEYIEKGSVSCEFETIQLNEDFSGPYDAKTMLIRIGLKLVKVIPIGTMLIGSRGRVDISGPAGTARLVLMNAKISNPRDMVRVTIVDPKEPKPTPTERSPIEWAWKLIGSPSSPNFTDLNQESFLKALLEVSDA